MPLRRACFSFFFFLADLIFLKVLQACLTKCHEVLIFPLKCGCPSAISKFIEFSQEATGISFMVNILDTLMNNVLEFLKFQ